jgi:predicted dehydrogenase
VIAAVPGVRTATLFGYGNYAKTVIIPNLPPSLHLDRIHEVDPLQIPRHRHGLTWSTNPGRDADDTNWIAFVAGYHHTHADLAATTLRRGGTAVVEKPLVVNRAQHADLTSAMTGSAGRLFACFHKRYSPLNRLALEDLACPRGAPISYHAIVYEVPLPARHWYRWPNSHSAIVSNGCHWLDHFLWFNDYSPHQRFTLDRALDGSFNISVELDNGAYFTLVLTHRGSERIGMREYVELRTRDRTVRIIDNGDYMAEHSRRRLRRHRVNKMRSYGEMYARIGQAILRDEPGDSLASVDVGCRLMLDLDDAVSSRAATPS